MFWQATLALTLAGANLPTDTDLKASFCLGYLRDFTPVDPSTWPESARPTIEHMNRDAAQAQQRLRVYLVPKMPYFDDIMGVDAAFKQGRQTFSDYNSFSLSCLDNMATDQCQRMKRTADDCRETPFLPF